MDTDETDLHGFKHEGTKRTRDTKMRLAGSPGKWNTDGHGSDGFARIFFIGPPAVITLVIGANARHSLSLALTRVIQLSFAFGVILLHSD